MIGQFHFGGADIFTTAQQFHMGNADIGDHTHLRFNAARQIIDLPPAAHSHLEDRRLMGLLHRKGG